MGSFKVIIVGGGLSGALLANGLRNNDVDFMVYERDVADSKREGYQIRLGPGAQAGFQACLTDAHRDRITSKLGMSSGLQETAPALYTTQFDEILDLAVVPSYSKSAAINRVVLRDVLLEPIIQSKKIQHGKAFDRYEIISQDDGTEKVKVHFRDGSHDTCDVLINKQLGLNNIRLLDSHWSFLSKGDLPYERMMQMPARLRKGPIIVFHNDVTLYYALYLPGESISDSKHQAGYSKTALRYDEKAASFYWGLNIPVNALPYKSASEISNHREVCLGQIKDWAPEFHQLLSVGADDSDQTDMLVTQLRASTQPKADWRKRCQNAGDGQGHPRVWIMGDAIHAMQPNRGQGGNQALADCAEMLPQLLLLANNDNNLARPTIDQVQSACNIYEASMIPRAFQWVRKSGGSSFVRINFDGFLGFVVRIVARLVLPILKMYYSIFPQSDE
ncbi:FAD/NAD(P)-binding domain-containing protein [Colletotrichum tabaci]|uniref:FAD/NAD(P)-binding domain-containing protein n=1 Tax=Colletotrichum tabaci TaxID=1209068 RepID=A0AAV9TBG3_9PEZI